MNLSRVLRRLWVALSAIWAVAIILSHSVINGSTQYLRAEFGPAGYVLFVAGYVIGPPAIIYVVGWTATWIIAGFKR
jgi:hypothetical protein